MALRTVRAYAPGTNLAQTTTNTQTTTTTTMATTTTALTQLESIDHLIKKSIKRNQAFFNAEEAFNDQDQAHKSSVPHPRLLALC